MIDGSDGGLRFRVLVPVWGERYIRDFCAISLPALLASGNLPELVRAGDCEIIFLTTQASEPFFEASAGIQKIKDICGYSFIAIDDLLPLVSYGIILTVAYGRGIASMGRLQTSTNFVFLNADFVLSNGILRTVVDRVGRGFRAVMAPSMRAQQEEVVDDLERRVASSDATLDAAPDELVGLTLRSLHLTARASLVNQDLLHHNAANQFFWRVDDETMIGRFFLLFMLCIRPEREFAYAKGWCDYAFVPDLVPSGNYDVLTDSDEGFILEMQARRGERHYIMAWRIPAKAFAPRLSFWTTANHRDYATKTIVFHAGALPSNFAAVKAEADGFMDEIFRHLRRSPTSHLHHPYWRSGVLGAQMNFRPGTMPRELPRIRPARWDSFRQAFGRGRSAPRRVWNTLAATLIGVPPRVKPLHYGYLDYRNFAQQIAALRRVSRRTLQVRERPGTIDVFLADGPLTTVELSSVDQFRSAGEKFDGAIVTLASSSLADFPRLLRLVAAHCTDGAPVVICIDAVREAFFSGRFSVYTDMIELMEASVTGSIASDGHRVITSPERLPPLYRLIMLREMLASRSISAWIASLIVAPPAFARILLANLRAKPAGAVSSGFCTSATLKLHGPWQSMTQDRLAKACRFDPAFYNRTNVDVARAGVEPEGHFLAHGWKERRDPCDAFSVSGYLDANLDVAAAGINPWKHFVEHGVSEGRNGWQT